jgi:hypothetical protein
LPLIAGGAKVFAGLSLVLLFAWAALLRQIDVDFFHKLFQEPWFILPFVGAIGGLSIAMIRSMESVLGALRFILLLFCRIAMPITALFSATFVAVLMLKGTDAIFAQPYPGAIMLGLAFAGMLIFNGVYQNGQGEPPPAWLRLATLIALLAFPVYAGLAAYAFWLRIGEYGLTPPRVIGLSMNILAALYSVVTLAGAVTELNWKAQRWMPLVAPLNTFMTVVWIATLLTLATIVNPWAVSAKSQVRLVTSGKIDASKFDYGYLRFDLGAYGEKALDDLLALNSHPRAAEIAAGVARARAAQNRWEYDNPQVPAPAREEPEGAAAGVSDDAMNLPLNPGTDASADESTPQ